ncbi:hypothetical protein [Mangrovibacterium diazotrophicum]|uniref:Uncharacterized protein n=1 Tax=Mangrovibacterium diazotrophicum TaxID=1261403 RepID=A0A419VWE9_9BACT|nr:hypothetical protein [Mangrovibacterium diazotrophicum]RKD86396.1 hypothetical protein BC643_4087 [Mangrovibacterium diazotrophicum]
MAEFKSYIFEKVEPPKKFPLIWIIVGLLGIMLLNYASGFNNFWIYMICAVGVGVLNWYNRYGDFKYGRKQDLNGFFTDEIVIDESGVKISDRKYFLDEIKSIQIVYDNIYGSKDWNFSEGNFKKNGETNRITIRLFDDTLISNYFKLVSIEHAKQLLNLTKTLQQKVMIKNDWKINYNA